mmetsp:Transcript_37572/g.118589  ORF Transcript_37572/g.118589 Transcript_37572/m.118589 type:complete len:244 (+) Transcript_37572:1578-2309(+)
MSKSFSLTSTFNKRAMIRSLRKRTSELISSNDWIPQLVFSTSCSNNFSTFSRRVSKTSIDQTTCLCSCRSLMNLRMTVSQTVSSALSLMLELSSALEQREDISCSSSSIHVTLSYCGRAEGGQGGGARNLKGGVDQEQHGCHCQSPCVILRICQLADGETMRRRETISSQFIHKLLTFPMRLVHLPTSPHHLLHHLTSARRRQKRDEQLLLDGLLVRLGGMFNEFCKQTALHHRLHPKAFKPL